MQSPKRLDVFRHAKDVAVAVYQVTETFPDRERFGLTAQMRQAAVSIGSNIAEGCGRRGNGELLQFLYVASASASELTFRLELATELGALSSRVAEHPRAKRSTRFSGC